MPDKARTEEFKPGDLVVFKDVTTLDLTSEERVIYGDTLMYYRTIEQGQPMKVVTERDVPQEETEGNGHPQRITLATARGIHVYYNVCESDRYRTKSWSGKWFRKVLA